MLRCHCFQSAPSSVSLVQFSYRLLDAKSCSCLSERLLFIQSARLRRGHRLLQMAANLFQNLVLCFGFKSQARLDLIQNIVDAHPTVLTQYRLLR